MSYQVLARKWRPATFADLSGQEHVVTALANALARGRLHHAYLLTGTRGVGKTTIARILAKCLNCVKGVTPEPCGVCPACKDIDAGRFVDLLELDAASHTGIDNMREILDNARYAPTAGRYKVYLIDEVHMLSKPAFNSMLKTLEEPPEHVRFVLATTDPQKIPVTVLSRCLQFNLKPLAPAVIVARLAHILREEGIAFDDGAVALIARAAQGSLRDGLSLLDQAIAFGGGAVDERVVRSMLGTVDREYVYRIADALAAGDGAALLAESDTLAERGLSSAMALDELASLFHRIAVAQVVPAAAAAFDDHERIAAYAGKLAPDAVQLHYQIATQGREDLPLAPDDATGMAMTLLRMLAFAPDGVRGESLPAQRTASVKPPAAPGSGVAAITPAAPAPPRAAAPVRDPIALPAESAAWPGFVAELKLTGMVAQLAAQTELKSIAGNALTLALPVAAKHLADKAYTDKLKAALEQATGRKLLLAFEVGAPVQASLAATEKREAAAAQAEREAQFRDEPFVRDLLARFDGQVKSDTIAPLARDADSK
ncbi:MAG: DNA polymerase III subunit gamma/tau [Burkholderiales bacterium]|nr:DNA polymerase III subunit gamma/tau [Burkholderiales bacterium]